MYNPTFRIDIPISFAYDHVRNLLLLDSYNDLGTNLLWTTYREYSSARILDSQDKHAIADDYVGFSAFRMFNIYLCFYAIVYDAFCLIYASE